MKPTWETTRMRNHRKEHRSSTIASLRALLDETEQMLRAHPSRLALLQHAWWHATHGVRSLLETYAADAHTVTALRGIMSHIHAIRLRPDDGTPPYSPPHAPFIPILFFSPTAHAV